MLRVPRDQVRRESEEGELGGEHWEVAVVGKRRIRRDDGARDRCDDERPAASEPEAGHEHGHELEGREVGDEREPQRGADQQRDADGADPQIALFLGEQDAG